MLRKPTTIARALRARRACVTSRASWGSLREPEREEESRYKLVIAVAIYRHAEETLRPWPVGSLPTCANSAGPGQGGCRRRRRSRSGRSASPVIQPRNQKVVGEIVTSYRDRATARTRRKDGRP